MAIPERNWTPWVGKRLAQTWKITLIQLESGNWIEYRKLVYDMLGFGEEPLAPKTVSNVISRALKQGVLEHDRKNALVRLSPNAPIHWLEPPKRAVHQHSSSNKKAVGKSRVFYGEGGWSYQVISVDGFYHALVLDIDGNVIEKSDSLALPGLAAGWAVKFIEKTESEQ